MAYRSQPEEVRWAEREGVVKSQRGNRKSEDRRGNRNAGRQLRVRGNGRSDGQMVVNRRKSEQGNRESESKL